MKAKLLAGIICILFFQSLSAHQMADSLKLFTADNSFFRYTGRIDFSNQKLPRYWMPGVYVKAKFTGSHCTVLINDEMPNAKTHNYIEIVVDDNQPVRLQLTGTHNEIEAAKGLGPGAHTIVICKNTEAGTGYIEFAGLKCLALKRLPAKPARKIEFIGNSITCGTGSDQSEMPCGKGLWQDQHNAYMSYGALTAGSLKAQYHLSAVSGIGLMHSCCKLTITMPQVFDKINMRADSIAWDFKNYMPDVVTICLGQNDGRQDSTVFCDNYINFIKQVRQQYARATIVCLSSPMADEGLVMLMKSRLGSIVQKANNNGDKNIYTYYFSKRYHNGCDSHPDLSEHREIANELITYLKKLKGW